MMDADLFQKQQKLRRKFYGVRPSFAPHVLFFVILATTYYLLPTTYYAFASPPPTPGFGSGAVSTNAAGNLGVGTPTPLPETKLLIVASSSADAANYTLKILYPNSSPILVVRNDGSVGIGTASPGYQLDVNGTIHGNFNGTVNAGYVTPAVFNSLEADSGVPYGFPHSVFVSSALGVTTSSASNLPQALSVYGGGYFSGSVGIGTPSPQNTLDVFGAFKLRDMAGSNNGYVFAPASDNSVLTIGYQNPSSWYSQIMTLAYGGNVGIGTASPATTLHVVNGSKFAKFDLTSNGTDALLQLGPAAVANWARIGSNGSPMAFLTQGSDSSGASPALFINNNGNVGIGNTAPVAKLDIQSGSTSTLRLDNTNGSNVDWIKFTTSNGAFTYADLTSQSYGLNLALGTGMGGGPYFSITNGNVGIGTTTPAYPLVVAGVGSFTSAVNSSWVGSVTGNNSNATTNGILGGQVGASYWVGVAGQSAAGNGVGVYGLATNSGGYGGYFTNSGGGYALYVNGYRKRHSILHLRGELHHGLAERRRHLGIWRNRSRGGGIW